MPTTTTSPVTAVAASAHMAEEYFTDRLAFETDPSRRLVIPAQR